MSDPVRSKREREGYRDAGPARSDATVEAAAMGNQAFAALARDALATADPWAGQVVPGDLQRSIDTRRGSGQPLARDVASQMGDHLGDDLSDVRVHTDSGANELARSVQARAFTTGRDVFFGAGEYRPGSSGGDSLLAHELAHVVQQRGTATSGQLRVSTPGDAQEREADAVAGSSTVARTAAPAPTVARDLLDAVAHYGGGMGQAVADAADQAVKAAADAARLAPLQAALRAQTIAPLEGASAALVPGVSPAGCKAITNRIAEGARSVSGLPWVNDAQKARGLAANAALNGASGICEILGGAAAGATIAANLSAGRDMLATACGELARPAEGSTEPPAQQTELRDKVLAATGPVAAAATAAADPELDWATWSALYSTLPAQIPSGHPKVDHAKRIIVGAVTAGMAQAKGRDEQIATAKAGVESGKAQLLAAGASIPNAEENGGAPAGGVGPVVQGDNLPVPTSPPEP